MQNIQMRFFKVGVVGSLLMLILLVVDKYTTLWALSIPGQFGLLLAFVLFGMAIAVVSARGDAKRARTEVDVLFEAAVSEEAKSNRLCVMASAQIRCYLEKSDSSEVLSSTGSRYDIVKSSKDLEDIFSSISFHGESAGLLELYQRIKTAEKAAQDYKGRYEQLLRSYRDVRESFKTERLRRLFDLKEYPPKEKPSQSQTGLGRLDPKALNSRMQICMAWANI